MRKASSCVGNQKKFHEYETTEMKDGWAEMFVGKGGTSGKREEDGQREQRWNVLQPHLEMDQKVGLESLRTFNVSSSLDPWGEIFSNGKGISGEKAM